MEKKLYILIISLCFAMGCQTTFIDVGAGYARFNLEDIDSATVVTYYDGSTSKQKSIKTKLDHTDAFMTKLRIGGSFVEALPQLRAGVVTRGAFGGGSDSERENGKKVYSEIVMIMLGAGPFISWQQPLTENLFIESGAFISGYTVGVHESGRVKYGYSYSTEEEGGTGWSGGAYGKIGIKDAIEGPVNFALEASYEVGEWDFGGDIGNIAVEGFSVLFSSEIEF